MNANEVYDRQIRLWGVEAQKRMQEARVLVCGVRGMNIEVLKNIILAGSNAVVIDDDNVVVDDLHSNYFLNEKDLGKNIAEATVVQLRNLNKFTTIEHRNIPISEIEDSYFENFTVVLISSDKIDDNLAIKINQLCRVSKNETGFFLSGSFGEEGWFLSDLGDNFRYKEDPPNNQEFKNKAFQSLQDIYSSNLSQFNTRLNPLSKTFVKSRIISLFK